MPSKIISLITAIAFIPVQLGAFNFERPHDNAVQKPKPESCVPGICYSVNDEKKLLKMYNAYLFFMSAWPILADEFEAIEKQNELYKQQIDSLESDLSIVKTDRDEYSEKYQKSVKNRLEAESWTPFGDAAPWYVAAGITLFSTGVVAGVTLAD